MLRTHVSESSEPEISNYYKQAIEMWNKLTY